MTARNRQQTRRGVSLAAASCLLAGLVGFAALPAPAAAGQGGLPPLVAWHLDRIRSGLRQRAFRADWRRLRRLYPGQGDSAFIVVDIATERLDLFLDGQFRRAWSISTSRYGIGRRQGSLKTPTGVFRVTGVVGQGAKRDAVLGDHGATGRIADPVTAPHDVAASNLILARILTLKGLQPHWNTGGDVDTARRDIYIHGTANVGMLGRPASHGCVQMAPRAVIRLAKLVPDGALVLIIRGRGDLRKIPGPLPNAPRAVATSSPGA